MPELPEVQAHAERLSDAFVDRLLVKFVPLTFTALKTALPAPDEAYGTPLRSVGRRGKYILLHFDAVTFIIHLMQGGRLLVDEKKSAKPRGGQARLTFTEPDGDDAPALLLTEAGTERRAGVWCVRAGDRGVVTATRQARARSSPRHRRTTARAVRGEVATAPRLPPRPAIDRRDRPPARQRGLPPGEALAVRIDEEARDRRRTRRRRRRSRRRSPRDSSTSAHAPT